MPLPEGGKTAWPPKALDDVFARLDSWDAWYTGDPDHLADVYGGPGSGRAFDSTSRARVRNRPSQYRGGVVGKVSRWFWGAPTSLGEVPSRLHMPLAGDIAQKSTRLLFAEPPQLKVDHAPTAKRLATQFERLHASLLEAGETCAGLGGTYLRVVWDKDVRDTPWLHAAHADQAVPEWSWDVLRAVTFWRILEQEDQRVVWHLERHEPGVILHGVYEGTPDTLGKPRNLKAYEATADLAERIETRTKRLTVVYVPNMRPNKLWRKNPAAAPLGRADISGAEGPLDRLDETWTSLMRDLRLGKGRAFVPDVYLQGNGPGRGASWDAEQEIYATLSMLPGPDSGNMLTLNQFDIRVEEHLGMARQITIETLRSAGYSLQSFGLDGDVAATATEVSARERDSYLTRGHKILYWKPELADITLTLQEIDKAWFGADITPELPDVEWPDGVADDPEKVARTLQLLHAAEAVSIRTRVERANPDWPKERVDAEVAAIKAEQGGAMTGEDPIELGTRVAATGRTTKPDDDEGQAPDDEDDLDVA
ncbi:hypothetical protein [Saccharothrix sp. HUAS TT1]|uniref:hypothetical protein n=1 Tax=unclassified Saccharothrix TaxID=2593673 RepID=UPI00345C4E0C